VRLSRRILSDPMSFKEALTPRMASSGMLRRVTLVKTHDSEELSASIIRVTRIGELGTLVITINRCTP
jgi:hypothetical protein